MGTGLFSQCLSQLKQNVQTEFSHKPLGKLCLVPLLLNKIGLDLNYSGLCVKNGGYATERERVTETRFGAICLPSGSGKPNMSRQ